MADVDLDCAGLSCPVPIVRISRAMKELSVGDRLTVTASDPSFRADVEAWVRKMGHVLEAFSDSEGQQTAVIRHASEGGSA
jgi:tRNA 2-thiouridine synthesizing protein A